jgi:hypothetical protein
MSYFETTASLRQYVQNNLKRQPPLSDVEKDYLIDALLNARRAYRRNPDQRIDPVREERIAKQQAEQRAKIPQLPVLKIVVEGQGGLREIVYETDLKVRVGSKVLLPNLPWHYHPDEHISRVLALESSYTGPCKRVLRVLEY